MILHSDRALRAHQHVLCVPEVPVEREEAQKSAMMEAA